jgi:predicted MFS family arabinose efflux permease
LLISAVLVGAGSSVWWAFSVEALRAGGLGATPARIVYAASGIVGTAASVAGIVFGRVGLRRGYLVAVVLLGGSIGVLTLAAAGITSALVAAAAFGVLYPTVIAAQGIWSVRIFADHPTAGLAAMSTALTLGTLGGPAVAGQLVNAFGYSAALAAAAAVVVLATPFCPPGARRRARLARHRCRATPVRD